MFGIEIIHELNIDKTVHHYNYYLECVLVHHTIIQVLLRLIDFRKVTINDYNFYCHIKYFFNLF